MRHQELIRYCRTPRQTQASSSFEESIDDLFRHVIEIGLDARSIGRAYPLLRSQAGRPVGLCSQSMLSGVAKICQRKRGLNGEGGMFFLFSVHS